MSIADTSLLTAYRFYMLHSRSGVVLVYLAVRELSLVFSGGSRVVPGVPRHPLWPWVLIFMHRIITINSQESKTLNSNKLDIETKQHV